jgi:regulatory protein
MVKVAAVHIKPRAGKVRVEIDDGRAFEISRKAADEAGLVAGLELPEGRLEALMEECGFRDALQEALRFLGIRPRSEAEVSRYLRRRHRPDPVIERVVTQLRGRKELDDAAFARFWVENRVAFRPRSRRLIRGELRQKGISAGLAEKMVDGVDDELAALALGRRRAARLSGLEWPEFRLKLGGYLQRRDFCYETIERVTRALWQERSGEDQA